MGAGGGAGGRLSSVLRCAHWVQVVGCCLMLCLSWRVPSLCPLSYSSLVALLANMALFRVLRGFLARFICLVWVCVVLVVCVDCGAFVRVWS